MVRLSLTAAAITTFFALALGESDTATEPCAGDVTIWSQSDLDNISGCPHYTGTITIEKTSGWELAFRGVEYIAGNVVAVDNSELQSLSLPDLKRIDGGIILERNPNLSKFDVPQLQSAYGISLAVLPSLDAIEFPAGLYYIGDFRVEDTKAPTINGFLSQTVHSLVFTNNNYMPVFDFSSVEEVTGDMLVVGNRNMLFKAEKLKTMKTSFFFHLGELKMPNLEHIQGDLSFHSNEIQTITFERLHTIDGTVVVANNDALKGFSFPNLNYIGGALSIGNNSALNVIDGFPVLTEIGGVADFAGSFMEYKLPSIGAIHGGARIQTTSSKLQCADSEQRLKGGDIAKGLIWSCTASIPPEELTPTLNQAPEVPKPENLQPGFTAPIILKPEEKKPGSPESNKGLGSGGNGGNGASAGSPVSDFGNSMKDTRPKKAKTNDSNTLTASLGLLTITTVLVYTLI